MRIIVKISAGEALEKGIWPKLCELLGIDFYSLSEGTLDEAKELELSEEQARGLGLIQ